jgi:hypothetical protein
MELVVAGSPNEAIIEWVKDAGRSSSNLQRIAQSLVQAVRDSPVTVGRLLGEHEDMKKAVNEPVDDQQYRALHLACALCNSSFEALMGAGADARVRALNGETPLHSLLASSVRVLTTVVDRARVLLDAGADVNAADEKGTTPLHLACIQWSGPLVKLLLERGADPSVLDQTGISCLIAIMLPHLSLYYQNWNQLMVGEEKGEEEEEENFFFFFYKKKFFRNSSNDVWRKPSCSRHCSSSFRRFD